MSSQTLIQPEIRPIPQIEPNISDFVQTTNCMRCGRKLTAPASVAAGIGPVCRRTIAYETRRRTETPNYRYTPRTYAYLKRKDRKHAALLGTITSFSSDLVKVASNFFSPALELVSGEPIPHCSYCERHNVRGQVKSKISQAVGRDICVCIECLEAQCNLKGPECYYGRMYRPSPIPDYVI